MQVSGCVIHSSYPTEGHGTICRNGEEQVFGLSWNHIYLLPLCSFCLDFVSPANREELFNLRHASARNAVERIFGVLKKRYVVLTRPSHFDMDVQARIPPALAAVHNFIWEHDWDDIQSYGDTVDEEPGRLPATELQFGTLSQGPANQAEKDHASQHRDELAQAMWDDYQQILLERGGNNGQELE